jgi:hypothetical protein
VVVISHAYWIGGFGGSPSIVNQSVLINGRPMLQRGLGHHIRISLLAKGSA